MVGPSTSIYPVTTPPLLAAIRARYGVARLTNEFVHFVAKLKSFRIPLLRNAGASPGSPQPPRGFVEPLLHVATKQRDRQVILIKERKYYFNRITLSRLNFPQVRAIKLSLVNIYDILEEIRLTYKLIARET